MRGDPRFGLFAIFLFSLSACLTSDGLLFTADNARALALAAGAYDACEAAEDSERECHGVTVSHNERGLFRLVPEAPEDKGDAVLVRFKKIGRAAWAVQAWGEEGDAPNYLLATGSPNRLTISLIDCEELPAAFKKKLEARGDLEIRNQSTCVAKSAGAAVAAAKAWRKTAASKQDVVVYTKRG